MHVQVDASENKTTGARKTRDTPPHSTTVSHVQNPKICAKNCRWRAGGCKALRFLAGWALAHWHAGQRLCRRCPRNHDSSAQNARHQKVRSAPRTQQLLTQPKKYQTKQKAKTQNRFNQGQGVIVSNHVPFSLFDRVRVVPLVTYCIGKWT